MKTLRLSLLSLVLACPGQTPGSIVINEVMYDPPAEQTEWIEIFNDNHYQVELSGWTIEDSDSTKPRMITDAPLFLAPDEFLCLVQDPAVFLTTFPSVSCPVLKPVGTWPRLNNSGDHIVLRDARGAVVDRIEYEAEWGGQNGRSLERVHPDWPSNEAGTWSSCSPPVLDSLCCQQCFFLISCQQGIPIGPPQSI